MGRFTRATNCRRRHSAVTRSGSNGTFGTATARWVASAGKIKGLRGAKLGNPYLRCAFGEAAVIAKRDHYRLKPLAQRLEARMNGFFLLTSRA